jgi:L-ascorbate metabolism protein UlaG (beta-lactamase superfamily)
MKNTTTVQFAEKQTRISRKRKELIDRYPALWKKMIAEWNTPCKDDTAWLMYSANYLLRTGNIQWALDPLSLKWRVPGAPIVDLCRDLQNLSFVLLTHSHRDHLDFDLLSALRHLPVCWVVPEFLLPLISAEVELPAGQILIPHPLQLIELEGIHILPFEGQHLVSQPDGRVNGVPSMAYMIEYSGKRWLFPGDTRVYDSKRLPAFGPVDTLFAHLWLGRGSALEDPPQEMDAFCQFCADFHPERVILTHLEEMGRDADDFWDAEHAQKIITHFQRNFLNIPMIPAYIGEHVNL